MKVFFFFFHNVNFNTHRSAFLCENMTNTLNWTLLYFFWSFWSMWTRMNAYLTGLRASWDLRSEFLVVILEKYASKNPILCSLPGPRMQGCAGTQDYAGQSYEHCLQHLLSLWVRSSRLEQVKDLYLHPQRENLPVGVSVSLLSIQALNLSTLFTFS